MGHSWYIIIFVFLLYITGSFSSSAVTVLGFIGDSAVLSCSIPLSELQDKIQDFNIHWRDNKGKIVCDIIGGNRACKGQAPEYKNRVETFPEEYKRGNFSIKLNDLQKNDTRKYTCTITISPSGPFQNEIYIELHVKDRPVGRGNRGGLTLIVLISLFSTIYFVL